MIKNEIKRLQDAKASMREAIQAKRVVVPAAALLDSYAGYISQIETVPLGGEDWNWIKNDGKGHYYFKIYETSEISLHGTTNSEMMAYIDWGDGSAEDIITGVSTETETWEASHEYEPGEYEVTITGVVNLGDNSTSGAFSADALTRKALVKAEMAPFSSQMPSGYFFTYAQNLELLVLHVSTEDVMPSNFLNYATKLRYIYNAETEHYVNHNTISFQSLYSLKEIRIFLAGYQPQISFLECYALRRVYLSGVPLYKLGGLQKTYSLEEFTGPAELRLVNGNFLNSGIKAADFSACVNVTTVPNSWFGACTNLISVKLPPNLTAVSQSMCNACDSLPFVDIPATVTKINNSAFGGCKALKAIHFRSVTPPTVTSANAFSQIPEDCVFFVPSGSLAAYQEATNLTTFADRMVEE